MASIAYALPVKPDQIESGMRLVDELIGKGDGFHKSRMSYGFDRIRVYRQDKPQPMVVFVLEGSDVHGSLANRNKAEHEFETWFEKRLEEITGHHLDDVHSSGSPSKLIFDWHKDKGHSKTEHH
jgi:hypothetical protein